MAKKTVGFIGLGAMGIHMARNLVRAGYSLIVHDLNAKAVEELVSSGARKAGSSAEAASAVELVITMLPADDEVKVVCLGPGGVLEGAKPGTVLIDMSSIAPHTSKQVAAEAQKKGVKFLDAPVSGGTTGAEKATLWEWPRRFSTKSSGPAPAIPSCLTAGSPILFLPATLLNLVSPWTY